MNLTAKKLRRYFFTGLIVIAPVGVTAVVLVWLFGQIDNILGTPLRNLLGFRIPGLGLVLLVLVVLGVGWAVHRAAGRQVLTLGGDATRSTLTAELRRHAGRWRVVHLAVPGRVDTARPALSGLSLTPDDPDQGLLSMLDVYGMRIPADLVLLSRCAAARGPGAKAEGVVQALRQGQPLNGMVEGEETQPGAEA